MFDQRAVLNLHKTAAYSFFVDGALSQTEISGILFHGWIGRTTEPLTRIAETTENLSETDWALVARDIDWFAHLAIETATKAFRP